MKNVIVIGGGASGLVSAIFAARAGVTVTILEKNEKIGKKLLLTGSGKCNITNVTSNSDCFYSSNHSAVDKYLKQLSITKTLAFFREIGLLTRTKESYVYPYTEQASSVNELLLAELKRLKVKIKCLEEVTSIEQTASEQLLAGDWTVFTKTWKYTADAVIICTGSKAAPQTGSTGDGYALATKLGHQIVPVLPALVPLIVKETFIHQAAGVRHRGNVCLVVDNVIVARETGEIQWTDYGVSGIVIFQLSGLVARALHKNQSVQLHLDLIPEYEIDELRSIAVKSSLTGILPKKLLTAFKKQCGEDIDMLVNLAKNCMLTVSATKSFEMAQICTGGVPLNEVDNNLNSIYRQGLYFAGELLDVDGLCGGFNLQWAWTSAYIAGSHAGATLTERERR